MRRGSLLPRITSVLSYQQIFSKELEYARDRSRPSLRLNIKVTQITRLFQTDSIYGETNMSQTTLNNDAKTPVTKDEVERVVRVALADALELPVDEVLPESDMEKDLGLDSLGLIQVNIDLEEQFHIPLLGDESPELALHTVSDLTAYVAERTGISSQDEEEQLC